MTFVIVAIVVDQPPVPTSYIFEPIALVHTAGRPVLGAFTALLLFSAPLPVIYYVLLKAIWAFVNELYIIVDWMFVVVKVPNPLQRRLGLRISVVRHVL